MEKQITLVTLQHFTITIFTCTTASTNNSGNSADGMAQAAVKVSMIVMDLAAVMVSVTVVNVVVV